MCSGSSKVIFVRARIHGSYNGKKFVYEDREGEVGSLWLSTLAECVWTDGSGSCDCNRAYLVGKDSLPCGETVRIEKIEPKDAQWSIWSLYLNEEASVRN
jgi:hypothetical protein